MEPRRSICGLIAILSLIVIDASRSPAVCAADGPKSGEATVILRGIDGKGIRLSRDDLKKLPRTEIEAADHRGKKSRNAGVALRTLLDKLKVPRGEGFAANGCGPFSWWKRPTTTARSSHCPSSIRISPIG